MSLLITNHCYISNFIFTFFLSCIFLVVLRVLQGREYWGANSGEQQVPEDRLSQDFPGVLHPGLYLSPGVIWLYPARPQQGHTAAPTVLFGYRPCCEPNVMPNPMLALRVPSCCFHSGLENSTSNQVTPIERWFELQRSVFFSTVSPQWVYWNDCASVYKVNGF